MTGTGVALSICGYTFLGILVITFGLSIKITMASIIGMIIAIITFRWL